MNNALPDLAVWIRALRALGGRAPVWTPAAAIPGSPATVEAAFAAWRSRNTPGAAGKAPANGPAVAPDAAVWWMLAADDAGSAGAFIDSVGEARSDTDRGALFPQGLYRTIEVWTESELASLHALWWIQRARGDADAGARMREAARWHLENTQPDNATNRPWALHAFLELSIVDANPEARLYAETLLHNATAANGAPEPFSAAILLDSADALELLSRG